MAHQTFYIDIDEEITSIVERLKNLRANEVIMVVPKRALLIQSIVNLKILKKEADEKDIQLMVVTQDNLGKLLAEKAGILVQQKIENLDEEEMAPDKEGRRSLLNDKIFGEKSIKANKKNRLDKIGSRSYFEEDSEEGVPPEENSRQGEVIKIDKKEDAKIEHLINKELVLGVNLKKGVIQKNDSVLSRNNNFDVFSQKGEKIPPLDPNRQNNIGEKKFFEERKDNPAGLFRAGKKEEKKDPNLSSSARRWFLSFGFILLAVIFAGGYYLFIPKVELKIFVKTKSLSIDSEVLGELNLKNQAPEKPLVEAKISSINHEIVKKIDATGSKSVSNQKARGKVVIYNEYDSKEQPLVATTRLLSSSGKLFRLVKGVTVPGMVKAGDSMKPGEIEAEVVADEAGKEYNIEPEKFTIPGFQGSGNDKYAKFYAKSKDSMSGGGGKSESAKVIRAEDIAEARRLVKEEFNKIIKSKIKESAGEDALVLDEAIAEEEAVYKLSNSQGDVADSFQISAQMKAKAIYINQRDFNQVLKSMFRDSEGKILNIDEKSLAIDYGKPDVDFEKGVLKIKFHATAKTIPSLDEALIKEEIAGKKEDELGDYLKNFPDVNKIEMLYSPSFLTGRIPFRPSQINIDVMQAQN